MLFLRLSQKAKKETIYSEVNIFSDSAKTYFVSNLAKIVFPIQKCYIILKVTNQSVDLFTI